MANGDSGIPRIPGFFIGGGVALSNTAIVVAGAASLLWLWLMMNQRPKMDLGMDDESMAQAIEGDIMAYAASPKSIHENRDRIRQALNRIRDTFRTAREAWQKKQRDLHTALRNGTITQAQYHAQRRAALIEFANARKARHKEIMELLDIPHYNANVADVTPTLV